jgi:hypothetical protein
MNSRSHLEDQRWVLFDRIAHHNHIGTGAAIQVGLFGIGDTPAND